MLAAEDGGFFFKDTGEKSLFIMLMVSEEKLVIWKENREGHPSQLARGGSGVKIESSTRGLIVTVGEAKSSGTGSLIYKRMQLQLPRSWPVAPTFPGWEVRLGSSTGRHCWTNEIR